MGLLVLAKFIETWRIFETAARVSLLTFFRDQYLALMTAITENPASHKCDVARGITICRTFIVKVRYSSFNEIQTFIEFPQ